MAAISLPELLARRCCRCSFNVEALESDWNWPEFEIRVQTRLIVSRPYTSPKPTNVAILWTSGETHLFEN